MCLWLYRDFVGSCLAGICSRAVMAATVAAIKREVGDPLEQLRTYFDTVLSLVECYMKATCSFSKIESIIQH